MPAGLGSGLLRAVQMLIAICLPLGLVLWAPGDLRLSAIVVIIGETVFAIVNRGLA